MKCYNCDSVISMQAKCPVCGCKIDKEEYNLASTKKIIKNIKSIEDFAKFIGLFYIKSIYLFIIAIVSITVAVYFLLVLKNNIVYMLLAIIFVLAFNFFFEMRKVESFYQDFQKGNNHYYILWPLSVEYRTFFTDANEYIPSKSVIKKRINAVNKRGKDVRFLRFNSFKLLHPQKPKLFMKKDKFFSKYFPEDKRHYLKTNDYNDESYVAVEGTIHGFLIMDSTVVTMFNLPRLTRDMLKTSELVELNSVKAENVKK